MSNLLASVLAGAGLSLTTAPSIPTDCLEWAMTGEIVTAPGAARAEAIHVRDGRVVATGPASLADRVDARCRVALPGDAVSMPGLHDGHAHLVGIGLREMELNLEGTSSVAELVASVEAAAMELDPGTTLYGRGWIETGWPEGRMPVAADLDAVVDDRPVILTRADGHAVVVNTAALTAAGIGTDTEDPTGGRIERDAEGRATGILIDNAMALVSDLLPELTADRRRDALVRGADVYARMGWTAIHNMSVAPADVEILAELDRAGTLPLRVFNYVDSGAIGWATEHGADCGGDKRSCLMGLKFYADGALGSRGALLWNAYADAPDTKGLQTLEKDPALNAYRTALDAGLQVATHAIGDRGNSLVLGWYKLAFGEDDPKGVGEAVRWRIEHAQILRPSDIPRFAYFGVIPSMQPSHAIGDLKFAPDRLGDDRLRGAYAWQPLLESGARVVGGSDAPVERGDPRIELYAATERRALDGTQGENWYPGYAVSEADALAMFTTHAAYGVFAEDRLGQLTPGYLADITVFASDPFDGEVEDTDVLMTVVGGVQTLAD